MARSTIVISLDAERDLDSLFDRIARDSGVDRAEAVLRRIGETLEMIATLPRIGRVRYDLDGDPRTFAVWPWVIV
jgi:plasmid stabilization system protein ParE